MGSPVMIMGESGSGKTYSIKSLDPNDVGIFLCEKSRLPFRKSFPTYQVRNQVDDRGQVVRQAQIIFSILKQPRKKIYIIDDSQYLMVNEFFDRAGESGYGKFTEIGCHFRDLIHLVNSELPEDVIVYFLHHTDQDSSTGRVKAKTIGRVLDDKLTLEGCFDIVLRTAVEDGQYVFRTQSDGLDTAKTPEGMFDSLTIPNDLALVDRAIREYYGLPELSKSGETPEKKGEKKDAPDSKA